MSTALADRRFRPLGHSRALTIRSLRQTMTWFLRLKYSRANVSFIVRQNQKKFIIKVFIEY